VEPFWDAHAVVWSHLHAAVSDSEAQSALESKVQRHYNVQQSALSHVEAQMREEERMGRINRLPLRSQSELYKSMVVDVIVDDGTKCGSAPQCHRVRHPSLSLPTA
jgi:predicted phosphoribosyltransferase